MASRPRFWEVVSSVDVTAPVDCCDASGKLESFAAAWCSDLGEISIGSFRASAAVGVPLVSPRGRGGGGAYEQNELFVWIVWIVFLSRMDLTSGRMEKLRPVRQCLSAGRRMPYFSGINGNGILFFSSASSSSSYSHSSGL